MANPLLESYASTFEEEISALQQELEASGLIKLKELSRLRDQIAKEELRKIQTKALEYQRGRNQPPTGKTLTYTPTPIRPSTGAVTKPRVKSVLRLGPGALPQLQGALRRLRFVTKPNLAVTTTSDPADTSAIARAATTPPTPSPTPTPVTPAPLPPPAIPAPEPGASDPNRERDTTWTMPRVLRTLPDGVTVNVPVGVRKYVVRYNGINRLLWLISETGEIRHIGDPRPASLGELRSSSKERGKCKEASAASLLNHPRRVRLIVYLRAGAHAAA